MPRAIAAKNAGAERVVPDASPTRMAASAPVDPLSPEREDTIPHLFWSRVRHYGSGRAALRHKELGIWREITWSEFGAQVRACACGFLSLGVEAGDRIALLSEDRPEWFHAELGIQSVGAATVGIYPSSASAQCAFIVRHSGARIWIVEDEEQFDKAAGVRQDLPDLEWVVVIDTRGVHHVDDPAVISFDELLQRGRDLDQARRACYAERLDNLRPDDMAILCYTSGTTGPPKGAIHTHATFLEGHRLTLEQLDYSAEDEVLCYMPLCHIGERFTSFLTLLRAGCTVNFAEKTETVFQDLREVAPTAFFGFPRLWERLMSRAEIGMEDATWCKRVTYRAGLRIGYAHSRRQRSGRRVPLYLRALHLLAEFSLFRKLRKRFGLDRVRTAIVSGAPVAPQVLAYFHAIGIPVREAYGMVEMGVGALMPENCIRLGTQGRVIDGVELRIAPDGEVLCRSPGLFTGYFRGPDKTAEALRHGWLHTGDRGRMDDEGYLVLTGRLKDLIVLSTGHNVPPQELENRLKASPHIMDAIVVGEGKPYLTALIVLDEEAVAHYAQTRAIPFSTFADLSRRPEVVHLVDAEVRKVNQDFAERDQVHSFRILAWELNREEEELTPTMKVRREFLCTRYADEIEEMYRDFDA